MRVVKNDFMQTYNKTDSIQKVFHGRSAIRIWNHEEGVKDEKNKNGTNLAQTQKFADPVRADPV